MFLTHESDSILPLIFQSAIEEASDFTCETCEVLSEGVVPAFHKGGLPGFLADDFMAGDGENFLIGFPEIGTLILRKNFTISPINIQI
jgi:hypothetical protein